MQDASRLASKAVWAARQGGDSGGILWLEHVNLVIGDRQTAETFYFEEGLGLTRDPAKPGGDQPGTMWANLGWQQLHLAPESPDDPPQAVRGAIGLVLPRARDAYERLSKKNFNTELHSDDCFTVRCPWGNIFHCYDLNFKVDDGLAEGTTKMAKIHRDDGRLTVRGGPGIRYLYIRCRDANSLANDYQTHLGQATHSGGDLAVIDAGVGPVHFIFESAPDDDVAENLMTGVHACVYVDSFATRYRQLENFVFTNPRFRHLDTCDTLDDALASRTFRFAFPDAPYLEHETRSLSHLSFLKHIEYHPPPPPSA